MTQGSIWGLLAILPKQFIFILAYLATGMKAYFSAKLCRVASFQHLLPVQMVTSCHFFSSCLHPTMTSPERTLPASSDYQKGLPGPWAMTLPASISLLRPQTTWHQPRFLSDLQGPNLQGPRKGSCCCCPALAMPRTHLSSDFNAGSSPDALRCRDLEVGTRCQKTLALETYSYSPERKDSLSKPHPFTATQFPFFVS